MVDHKESGKSRIEALGRNRAGDGNQDTIAAIATPAGMSGIGVIRVSGPLSKTISAGIARSELATRYAHFCKFRDAERGVIDHGIAIYFQAPASFTGEDALELFAHGGRILLESLLHRVIELGARRARPGEFTERAFVNGKIDLLQAEAVADLIASKSEKAARSALQSLEGIFSRKIDGIKGELTQLRVFCESTLDFPEEEIARQDVRKLRDSLENCRNEIDMLLENGKTGKRIREGMKIVITGAPNVGKSSLMNCLAGGERSIVTAIPGTTRDVIKEQLLFDGLNIELVDTAGIRDSVDEIEREGVRRASEQAADADIVLRVADAGGTERIEVEPSLTGRTILVRNKIDLYGLEPEIKLDPCEPDEVFVSAKNETGIDLLIRVITKNLALDHSGEDVFLARERHIEALQKAAGEMRMAIGLAKFDMELIAEHLRLAQNHLDEITGRSCPDDLLGEIFASFCIGK